ncbi:hypothetical protein JTB14_030808 [Gonioctena quinquepunctata]|nr:hypothetical protein JTB14_030808 [Gonioctena quinquepunctata]
MVVQQESVRLALNILDPEGVTLCRRNRLRRREYFSKGPNFLWHIDSYDKLKPYGIAINGCIDGFSRNVLWLETAFTNNDPAVISGYFMNTVESLGGCPKMIRTDMGTKNGYVEQMQNFFGDRNLGAIFIYGRSTANQSIESWWNILRKHTAQFWMNLFQSIKDNGHFDGSFIDKSLVQFVFMDIIQRDLDQVYFEWNTHRITGKKTSVAPKGRPFIMFELPELYGTRDYLFPISQDDIQICREECKYIEYPCDEDVYNLCKIIIEEKSFSLQNDPFKCVELY